MEPVTKTLHYKRAVLSDGSNLQEILTRVFDPAGPGHKIGNRKEIINAESLSFRAINRKGEYGGMLFCQLIMLEPGRSQAYVDMDDDAEAYTLDALTNEALNAMATEAEKKQRKKEFVDSFLYFGVLGNHVVVLQSQALKAREMEAHLGWLIGKFGGVAAGTAIILQDQPTQETLNKAAKDPVKSVQLGSPVVTVQENLESGEMTVDDTVEGDFPARKVRFLPRGLGADVLAAALGTDWFDTLNLEDDLDEANLKVSLEITYLRKTTKTGQRVIDTIATALRHMDEADVRIDLCGGGTIRGNELKLTGQVRVTKLTNGLYDEGVLYHTMQTWLVSKIRSGAADANPEHQE